jgi:phosphoglycerate dehydrogenase-like enzyme
MDELNIAITFRLREEHLRQITAVNPRIKVWDVAQQFGVEVREGRPAGEELDSVLQRAEVIYGLRLPSDLLSRAPRLKWAQMVSAGVDFVDKAVSESEVIITTASGIHAVPISEWVLAMSLMFAKQAPRLWANQQRKHWERFVPAELSGKTMGVIGLGNIGTQIARLAKAFGMRIVASRRSQVAPAFGEGDTDELLPPSQLHDLLAQSDFVVVSLPLTTETTKLIGEPELRAMKSSAYLINIARGAIVDEAVLIRALKEDWIAGAGLDVFETEPLPPDSELWELPNVILSPHITGMTEEYQTRATELFCDNLRRYLAGQKLINEVEKEKGY